MNDDISAFGVTESGFVVKPLTAILSDAFTRAATLFGPDIDLRPTSSFRKVLELSALSQATAWMALDDTYYAGFVASAIGIALDALGEDLGAERGRSYATGMLTVSLAGPAPAERTFTLPIGTIFQTPDTPPLRYALQSTLVLIKHSTPTGSERATAPVRALSPGISGNIGTGRTLALNPTYAARYLTFDPSFVTAKVPDAFAGGENFDTDADYRRELFALPRTLWTVDAVRGVVLALDGVRDALVYDPYGALDASAPAFGGSCFSDDVFQTSRDVCSPYFFSITVAPRPGVLWIGDGSIEGLRDEIVAAIAPVRPVSIFPTIALADEVEVAFRVTIAVAPGYDRGTIRAAVVNAYGAYIAALRLGEGVLAAQVTRLIAEIPGVTDVRLLRLRRCPPRFSEIVFGVPARFGNDSDVAKYEMGCGENVTLAQREIAVVPAGDAALAIEFTQL